MERKERRVTAKAGGGRRSRVEVKQEEVMGEIKGGRMKKERKKRRRRRKEGETEKDEEEEVGQDGR